MVAALVGIATSQGLRFELGVHATVGRGAASTIVLPDPLVSSVHAELLRDRGGRYRIVDLDATHGTFVNGTKVADHVLSHGDEIIVGATRLRFEDEPGTGAAAAPSGFSRASQLDVSAMVGRDYERLRLGFEVSRCVLDAREVYPLVTAVLDRVMEALPAERGVVLVREPGSDTLAPRARRQRGANGDGIMHVPRAILDQVTTHKVGLLALDATVDARFSTSSVLDGKIRSALAVPILDADELLGVIYLDAHAAGVFADRDLEVMSVVAGVTGLAIGGIRRRAFDAEAPGVRGATVVVVDPDAAPRGVIAAMLERGGYVVEPVADGASALAAAARRAVHVVVIDLALAGMTARQLGERFRGAVPAARVLYVATAADPAEVEELTAGGDGFVAKPFTAAEIVARVRTAITPGPDADLGRRRLERSATFANGAAFLAAYDAATRSFALPRRDALPVDRAIAVTVRFEDVEREFRVHGRTADGGRVVFGDDAGRELLLASANGESVPYFRRAHPRHPARLAVRLSAPEGLVIASHTQDVSARGLMLSTDHTIEIGTLVGLRIAFPGAEAPIEVAGRVQSSIATGPRRGVGIEFQFTSQAQRTDVADRVAKLGQ
jgi:CheY-like chemotaxis protein